MQAFALSTPLHHHPFQQCRSRSVCSQRPLLSPISRTRATLNQQGDHSSDATLSAATTATASVAEQQVIDGKSAVGNEQIALIRAQMEFWFSPSNLRRDWFMRKQMDPDGWLDPALFLRFNKIKSLNADINDIILACKTSDELEVSFPSADSFGDDIAQTRVRRSPELPGFSSDDDMEFQRSFIASGLPEGCTVGSLIQIFSRFAPVSYAHIYRNRNSPNTPRALLIFNDPQTAANVYHSFQQNIPEGCDGMILRRRDRPGDHETDREDGRCSTVLVCELNGLPTTWTWRMLHRHLAAMVRDESSVRNNLKFLMYDEGSDYCHISLLSSNFVRACVDKMGKEGIQLGGNMVSVRLLKDEDELAEYWSLAKEHAAERKARKQEKLRNADFSEQTLMQRNPVGVIVKVSGLLPNTKWRELRSELGKIGSLVYLTREENAEVCLARYGNAEQARRVVEILTKEDGGTRLCGVYVDADVLDGEEEIEYWKNAEEIVKRKQAMLKRSTSENVEDGEQSTEEESEE
eukprot:GFKZ01000467.1.p1 GENE.GFKZ01000467.1~~GFKZ01000467.1.p1  ORF type:complete len:520 (-),score=84.56 GFKZ01000467.1:716-2275(-)